LKDRPEYLHASLASSTAIWAAAIKSSDRTAPLPVTGTRRPMGTGFSSAATVSKLEKLQITMKITKK
jgi:hypothetical protein